ncbi:hypothetical protein BDZ91DRAFT_120167 [Kalaharituber pfeilii]|nr:hypothetical protein BDZ91DRAFT_120167 [Kalaharituber pfeilii]
MLLGRFYDESSLPRLFAATITPSVALKHSVSPTLSRKLPIQHSPRALLKSPTLSQARSVEVRSDAKQTPASISESNIPAEACLVRTPLGVDKGVSTATEDVTSASPNPARKESPVSPKRRKVARPTASPVTQGEMLEIPPPTASTAPAPHTASDFYRGDTAPIVSVYGVPVIQNARAPIVSETRKEASSDNVESEGEQAVLPPPPPLSLVHNDLDKKICPANGDPASIEDNIRTSLAKLSKPEQASAALATPSTSNEAPFPIVHTQKRSPTASQPQLAVVLPVLPSIRKLSPPVSSQSLQDRQNTPSSPITSDEDDDDRENNGAIISSATSPDVSLLLLEDSRSEIRSAEAIEKKDPIARIGDPSAQLRLEDELARKDHEESEVQDLKTTHHATEGLVNREDVDVVMEEKLGKEQEEVPTGQLDASEKIAVDEQNEEPISEVPVPISKVSPREDRVVEQALVGRQHEEPSQSIAVPSPDGSVPENMEARLSPANKVMEILPVLPPFTAKSPDIEAEEPVIASVAEKLPTLQEAPSQASENLKPANDADILSEVIEDKQDLEKSKTAEIVGPTLPSDRPNAPAACKSIVLSESAQRDTAENLDMETSPDRMDVDDTRATTIKKTATPHENNALTKHELEKVGQPRALRDRHINAEESDNISEDILVEPVEEGPAITVAAEVPRKTSPSFAVLKVLEQRRRKEQERLRLKKVVFVGDSAEEKLNSHGALKASTIPQGVNNAKFSQDVANFLSYSTKKRADPESIDLIHQPHVQVTRQRSSSITLAHGPSYQKKDYLTPYFQLEAFEHPLQDLLQKSHKTLLTSNHQLSIQEQQTKKVYRRIQQLQDKGLWSLRQPVRVREPRRRLCHWDYLLQEAHWMSIDFKQERRLKIAQCKQIADMVMQWHNAQPEERPFLCMNRQEWSKRMGVKGRKLLPQDMLAVAEEGHHETIIPNDNDTEDQEMENSLKTPKPEPISKYYMEIAQSPEPSRLLRNESLAEMGVKTECDIGDQYENEEADMFTHLGNPPAQLFTLGPGETVFEMPLTDSANEILSQLPIFAPPTLPIDPSILDNQFEENWQMPIIPVSKLCVAIMKFKEEGPPRKRSRYEYEENYNLFADDSDAEDLLPGDIQNGSFAGNPEKSMSQTQPVPLPPESTNVALFNPSFKHILNRMRQGHNFKPPAFPPVAFFENRQPSHWLPSEDEKLKDLVQRYPQNWSLISTFMTFKEISSKINVPSNVSATAQNGTGGSGSSTPTIRRRGNNPVRVERRKNTKFVSLFDSMRKLAKRREVTMTKQQNAAGIANRKAELQSQTKPKLQNFVPAYFSKMKYERELKQEKLAQEKAALLAQQRAGQTHRAHPAQPHAFANGIPMQHHPAQVRNGAPGVNSPVVNTSNSNGLPPGTAGIPVHRASPSVPHTLPNGIVPVSSGAPVPGMNGIPHNSVQGVPQRQD